MSPDYSMKLPKDDDNVDNIVENLVDDVLDVVDNVQFNIEDQVVHMVLVVSPDRLTEPTSE